MNSVPKRIQKRKHVDKSVLSQEIAEVGQLPIVSKILELICKTTGMRFAAMTKITSQKWIALAVIDKLDYGISPGDELEIIDTLCGDVKRLGKPVIIDHVDKDDKFCGHPIPKASGFQSHISVPIVRADNSFYGTLCAIDPEPKDLKNENIISLFSFFADLISEHLDTVDLLKSSKKSLKKQLLVRDNLESQVLARTRDLQKTVGELARSNQELMEFGYIASHDLQEPLRKIQTYLSMMEQNDKIILPENARSYIEKITFAVERMRQLINDLLSYSVVQTTPNVFETIRLNELIDDVVENLSEDIAHKNASLQIGQLCEVKVFPFQIRQLFQNLLSNSLKYSDPGRPPIIQISSTVVLGKDASPELEPDESYSKISVKDNGIGFNQNYAKKIFNIFERLHGKSNYAGTGIGLAIVRKIVENHHGFISVRSKENVGSEFTIFLPIIPNH